MYGRNYTIHEKYTEIRSYFFGLKQKPVQIVVYSVNDSLAGENAIAKKEQEQAEKKDV